MSWVDLSSIFLDLVTLLFVARATREIKASLVDARHERLDINRRIEVLGRRVDKRELTPEPERDGIETAL